MPEAERAQENAPAPPEREAIAGCLLGGAVGDALGLPYEGLTRRRAARLLGPAVRHRFLLGRGMISDDTEHAIFTAQALIAAHGRPELFERRLARSLRWWLASVPAGVGFATLRSILKLWIGFPPSRSGVFSAGNGPAMRSPLLGVACGGGEARLREFVLRSTRMTHSDPRAYHAALAAAVAARLSATGASLTADSYLAAAQSALAGQPCGELMALLAKAAASAQRGDPLQVFAESIGCGQGVSGCILHTVPCVVQVWLRRATDFGGAMTEMISAGGDADTTAAILGAIIGARVGRAGIPPQWLSGLNEWPHNAAWLERLAQRLHDSLRG